MNRSLGLGITVCLMAGIFYCYEYILRIVPGIVAIDLMKSFQISATQLGYLSAFYYHAYTPMQIPVGIMMDRMGPRCLLPLACLLCAAGMFIFSSTHLLWAAQISRFIVGFGSAFAFVGVLRLASTYLPQYFPVVAACVTSLGMIGAIAGNALLGSWLVGMDWRSCFFQLSLIGFALSVILFISIPSFKRATLSDGRVPASRSSADSKKDYGNLLSELRSIVCYPLVWWVGLVGCLLYLSLSAFAELWSVPYFESVYHMSKIDAARVTSMVFLGWAVGGPLIGLAVSKFHWPSVQVLMWGSFFSGLSILPFIFFRVPDHQLFLINMMLFLFGFFCSCQNLVFSVNRDLYPAHLTGTVMAFTNMIVMIGGTIFQPIFGWLLDLCWDQSMKNGMRYYTDDAYTKEIGILTAAMFISCFICWFLRQRLHKPKSS